MKLRTCKLKEAQDQRWSSMPHRFSTLKMPRVLIEAQSKESYSLAAVTNCIQIFVLIVTSLTIFCGIFFVNRLGCL
jgi:hypothetical protein